MDVVAYATDGLDVDLVLLSDINKVCVHAFGIVNPRAAIFRAEDQVNVVACVGDARLFAAGDLLEHKHQSLP
jgi:hypothetical protein